MQTVVMLPHERVASGGGAQGIHKTVRLVVVRDEESLFSVTGFKASHHTKTSADTPDELDVAIKNETSRETDYFVFNTGELFCRDFGAHRNVLIRKVDPKNPPLPGVTLLIGMLGFVALYEYNESDAGPHLHYTPENYKIELSEQCAVLGVALREV